MRVEVKPVAVNGIVGSAQTTLDGGYPVSRPLLFVFTCRSADDTMRPHAASGGSGLRLAVNSRDLS